MTDQELVPRDAESKNDNYYSLQLTRWYLKTIGAWPETGASNTVAKVFVILHVLACWSVVFSIMMPCFLYVSFEDDSIQAKLSALGPLFHRTMGSMNYWTLLYRRNDIRKCIRDMETDWRVTRRSGDREVMMQYAKFGRLIAGICGTIMQSGTFLFGIAKGMKTVTIIVDNNTITMHPMTCPIYSKILDTRFSPVNEIMLMIQFTSMFIVGFSTVGICSLAAAFATHACGQLSVLYKQLEELAENDKKEQTSEKKLIAIVKHHIRILNFISRVESIMNKACLVEIMGCTMTMCLLGYYCIMNWLTFDAAKITSYVTVYISLGFNVFIFCYIGEILTEQCRNVGQMAYMTNWYDVHHKTALGLILIIVRSSKVTRITAGKLFHLSIATFGDVVKSSMVYLNILRTMIT